jgi:cell division protein FtsA
VIEIVPVGRSETRGLSREILCDIMQPRAIELLQHIAQETTRTKLQIPSGVVLTGGGSMVRGMVEIAEQVFDAPTRHGIPEDSYFSGLAMQVRSPAWATSCGLALSSMREQIREQNAGGRSATKGWRNGSEIFAENLNKCACRIEFCHKSLYAHSPTAQYLVIYLFPSFHLKPE